MLKIAFSLIAAALFILILLGIRQEFVNPDLTASVYVTRDSALLLSTINTIPYEVTYVYPLSFPDRILEIDTENHIVSTLLGSEYLSFSLTRFPYQPNIFYTVLPQNPITSQRFHFIKRDRNITVSSTLQSPLRSIPGNELSFFKSQGVAISLQDQTPFSRRFESALHQQLRQEGFELVEPSQAPLFLDISFGLDEETVISFSNHEGLASLRPSFEIIFALLEDRVLFSSTPLSTSSKTVNIVFSGDLSSRLEQSSIQRAFIDSIIAVLHGVYS